MNLAELQQYHSDKLEQHREDRVRMGMSVESIKIESFLQGVQYAIDSLNNQAAQEEKPQ